MQIKGTLAILQKVVFELRYRRGYAYLDRCGRTLNAFSTQQPEWVVRSAISPQSAPLTSLKNGCTLNFSATKFDLALEMTPGGDALSDSEIEGFSNQVYTAGELIIDELGLKEFERIGFRAWYLFPCKSDSDSYKFLADLGIFHISERFAAFIPGHLESIGLAAVFKGETSYRIALNQVEQSAEVNSGQEILRVRASKLHKNQKEVFLQQQRVKKRQVANPQFAAMIDVDVFQDDPGSVNTNLPESPDSFLSRIG